MSDILGGADAPGAGGGGQATPSVSVLAQYVKDMSFENPRAPDYGDQTSQPQLEVNVDVRHRALNQTDHEVVLNWTATAKDDAGEVFIFELLYGGVFRVENLPADALQPFLFIECPRILFPFARRLMADATKEGGFPPLYIDPIDFVALYRARMQRAQQEAAGEAGPTGGDGGGAPSLN